MNLEKVKIAYSSNQQRIRITFPCALCMEAESPPQIWIDRTKAKFEAEKNAGHIAYYRVYDDEVRELWQAVREDLSENPDATYDDLIFTMGCGSPHIDGVLIEPGDNNKTAYHVTITADPDVIKACRFDFFKINVEEQLKQLGIHSLGNQGQLFACFAKAGRGELMMRRAIAQIPVVADDEKGYSIVVNKSRHEIVLMVRSNTLLRDRRAIELMLIQVEAAVKKYAETNAVELKFLRDPLVDRLKSSVRGKEFFGIGLPAMYLMAFLTEDSIVPVDVGKSILDQPNANNADATSAPNEKTVDKENYPGRGYLNVAIENDRLSATVEGFDKRFYDHPEFKVNMEWVNLEIARQGIVHNADPSLLDRIAEKIEKRETFDGVMIVKGTIPVTPKGPYIHEVYKDSRISESATESVDMREMQQRNVVREGDLVFEVRYKQPAGVGTDIFGLEVNPMPGEAMTFTVNEGIKEKNKKFYAEFDGIPKLENNILSISRLLVHAGDVNLLSGNIHFNGDAEITGSIESGATVHITGSLTVHGTIQDAHVNIGGNLDVKAGIVTGQTHILRVKGNIMADFIENSRIICSGDVLAKKAILNSQVVSGGKVGTEPSTGVIGGGEISSLNDIETSKLGFPSGAITRVFAGINFKAKITYNFRNARFTRISAMYAEDRNGLRDLVRKPHKTKKLEEQIQVLHKKVNKTKLLLEKLKLHVEKAKKAITYNEEARIHVKGILHANTSIEIAGIAVGVTHDVAEVTVSPRRSKGSNIHAMGEEGGEGGDSESNKKAS